MFGLLLLCGVGLPLPEDIPLIAAGILVEKGEMHLAIAAIFAWFGIIGGDCILYTLGYKFGADVSKIPFIGAHINVRRMKQVEKWFDHYGVLVVAVGRLFAGVRGAMVVVAGATKFRLWKFLLADGLAAVVSGGLFLFLGYKFAENLTRLHELIHKIKGGMLIGLLVIVVGLAIYFLVVRRRKPTAPREDPHDAPTMPPPAPQQIETGE